MSFNIYVNNSKTPKSERWTENECDRLFDIVTSTLKKRGCTQLPMGVWKFVARYVGGKSASQCQAKWYRLKTRMEEHQERREPHQSFLSSEEQSQNKPKRVKLNTNEDSSLNDKFQSSTSSAVQNSVVVKKNATPSPDRKNQKPATQRATSSHEERKREEAMLFFELILNNYLKLTDSQQLQFKIDVMALLQTLPDDM